MSFAGSVVSSMKKMRTEGDSLGDVSIPADRLYGASTARAVENFRVSALRLPTSFVHSLARIKRAAAQANAELELLTADRCDVICAACDAIVDGKYDEEFVLDVFQTGSGTSTNMNMNEVIANVANQALGRALGSHDPVHPNDHVNLGQSSNDVFPTAMHVAAVVVMTRELLPALEKLKQSLDQKAKAWRPIFKNGRTHLQDATPVSLGEEFSAYAEQIRKAVIRLQQARDELLELPLGGTAVGTGINTHPNFSALVLKRLSKEDGVTYREASNHFEANASRDACVAVSGALKTMAVSLSKIADDIRWMSSDVIGELRLPVMQPGSSIMPGKVNPVICESLLQVCARVIGNDTTVTLAGLGGNFELNTMLPVMTHALLESLAILSGAVTMFDMKCVQLLEACDERMKEKLARNPMLATALVPLVGYDRAALIAKKSRDEHMSVRDAAVAAGVAADEVDRLLASALQRHD